MFENEKVNHVRFGEGSVIECDGSKIKIAFNDADTEKVFAYPTVFEKFVKFDSEYAQAQVNIDLTSVKEEEAKLNNMKRLLYLEQEKRRKTEKLAKAAKKKK